MRVIETPTSPYSNDVSTRDTVELMTKIAIEQSTSPIIQSVIQSLQLDGMTERQQVRTIWQWVQSHLTFKEDEITLIQDGQKLDSELLRTPEYLLTVDPNGDCDDFSLLVATLLLAGTHLGVSFCTIKMIDDRPDEFSHIYVAALTKEGVIPMDSSHGPYCGWEMPDQYTKDRKYWVVRKPKDLNMGMNCVMTSGHPGDAMNMGLQGIGSTYLPGRGLGGDGDWAGEAGTPTDWGGGGGTDWGSILSSAIRAGISTVSNVVNARYAVPPAGTAITSPAGTIVRTTPTQTINPSLTLGAGGINGTTLLMFGGLALLLVVMSKK